MHRLKEKFFEQVKSLNEGQLLQQTSSNRVNPDTIETFDARVVIGRGDIKAFVIWFAGDVGDLRRISYTFRVNGKSVNEDLPALAYRIDPQAALDTGETTGTGRIVKTIFPIPGGAKTALEVTSGAITNTVDVFVCGFFTDFFIPRKMTFNLIQNFEFEFPDTTNTTKRFVIPAARGRVVGLSVFMNEAANFVDKPNSNLTVQVNGVTLLENVSPAQFLSTMNMEEMNNWIVNIAGGGTITISLDNASNNPLFIGVTLFFSEELASKFSSKLIKKQQRIS